MQFVRNFELEYRGTAYDVTFGDPIFYDESVDTVTLWIREFSIEGEGEAVSLVPPSGLYAAALELLGRYEDDVQDERRECAAEDRAFARAGL